ncbi:MULTISPECIES: hypothetical protein [Burkholderiaceae]|uniref:hypothetical protein n=1 Tax=Burkholderiaceae TaxID=119060 RepID=UPI0009B25AB4
MGPEIDVADPNHSDCSPTVGFIDVSPTACQTSRQAFCWPARHLRSLKLKQSARTPFQRAAGQDGFNRCIRASFLQLFTTFLLTALSGKDLRDFA